MTVFFRLAQGAPRAQSGSTDTKGSWFDQERFDQGHDRRRLGAGPAGGIRGHHARAGNRGDVHRVGSAFAMEKMRRGWPDVIVLDIEMPRMNGLSFLRKLMAERPTPVVICSSLAESGSDTAMQALAAGAVTIISKPKVGLKDFLQEVQTISWRRFVLRHAPTWA